MNTRNAHSVLMLLSGAAAILLLSGMAKKPPAPPPPRPAIAAPSIAPLIKQDLEKPPVNGLDLDALRRFYDARADAPVWTERAQAELASATVMQAGDDGLDPDAYHADALALRAHRDSAAGIAAFDLLLTDGLLKYARDMKQGRVSPYTVEGDVALPEQSFDAVATLSAALADNSLAKWIAALSPPHAEYAGLKKAYIRYRDIAAHGGWPQIPDTAKFKPGEDLLLLRQRLGFEEKTGDDLTAALKEYQTRNGLEADGALDKDTLASLNMPANLRATEIMLNMERWRWMPEFAARYIEVNTADATLKVSDDGKTVLTSRIIAGKRASPTPMFFAQVEEVTVNPPWNVPDNIARHEMLPKLRRDPNYLSQEHIVIVNGPPSDPFGRTIDWHGISAANFPFSFRQIPGDDNSLGYVKLEMPNRFNSYLHDTPSRDLFARQDRHLSHGCMRVEQIQPLASYALTGDVNAGLTQIKSLIDAHETKHVPLDRKLPVYVLYWTAIADADGDVGFRSDVYGRDARLLAALSAPHPAGRVSMTANKTACSAG
ncbi:MAG TPA: L,D-transpeptidase family protein [Rhizomicrobium sp.]|nr:L,D-transpeptidase family protein [Rhizomicrobium sp.]